MINLDQRPERWVQAKKNFLLHQCIPNRFSAVNGWSLSKWQQQELAGPYPLKISGGAIGCLLSHLSIYQDAYDRGFDCVWVCEDDLDFIRSPRELPPLIKELNQIDPNWDLLYTDHITTGAGVQWTRPGQLPYPVIQNEETSSKELFRIHGRFQTHSMVLSRKGLRKILHYFSHVYLWSPIDVDIHYVPGIREYSVKKDIVTFQKNPSYSDTTDPIKLQNIQPSCI